MSDEPYIWVNSEGNTNGSTGWVRSANAADAKKARESFILEGEWTKDRYGVVYTGTGDNTEWNRVTVKALQVQELPNDASHIGIDGDCGTAVAGKNAEGQYTFNIVHKASYLSVMPSHNFSNANEVKLKKIEVVTLMNSDDFLYGDYTWSTFAQLNRGLQHTTVDNGGNQVVLELNDFTIPSVDAVKADNSLWDAVRSFIVIAPGVHTLEFRYYITIDGEERQISKFVSTREYMPGYYVNVRHIFVDNSLFGGHINGNFNPKLYEINDGVPTGPIGGSMNFSEMKWYQWDADVDKPETDGVRFLPGVEDRFNITVHPGEASHSWANYPNANELYWYYTNGDIHFDQATVWTQVGGLSDQVGGAWITKKSTILAEGKTFSSEFGADGKDFRTDIREYTDEKGYLVRRSPSCETRKVPNGKPADAESKYFFIPGFGCRNGLRDFPEHVGNNGTLAAEIPSRTAIYASYTDKNGVTTYDHGYYILKIQPYKVELLLSYMYLNNYPVQRRALAYCLFPPEWIQ